MEPKPLVCTHKHTKISTWDQARVCTGCGLVVSPPPLQMSWSSKVRQVPVQKYKRLTRFREIVRGAKGELQGELPAEVLAYVSKQCLLRGWKAPKPAQVSFLLSRKRWKSKYAPHSVAIANYVTGDCRHSLKLSKDETRLLEVLFLQVDRVWPKVQVQLLQKFGWNRKTFFNYGYLLSWLLHRAGFHTRSGKVMDSLALRTTELKHRQELLMLYTCELLEWQTDFLEGNLLTGGRQRRPSLKNKILPEQQVAKRRRKANWKSGQSERTPRLKYVPHPV